MMAAAARECIAPVMPIPRILLLTASFGDGHNSAARGLAEALRRESRGAARIDVRNIIRETQPLVGRLLEQIYAATIMHAPWAWRQFYRRAGGLPLENDPVRALGPLREALARDLRADPPAAIACTFPLYPHLLHRILGRSPIPVHTVVTDSITIHPVWRCDSVATYFAADEISAAILNAWQQPGADVIDSGFPVSPEFADLPASPAADFPRKALFFPASQTHAFRRALHSLLRHGPESLEITVVLGRHADRLGAAARECAAAHPGRVHVLGWVDNVPALMTTHDVVIAKAGGATTHETAAAGRPGLIVKVVPGQEEGNAELVQRRGSGWLQEDPDALGPLLRESAASGDWRRHRNAAWRFRRPAAATHAAHHILHPLNFL